MSVPFLSSPTFQLFLRGQNPEWIEQQAQSHECLRGRHGEGLEFSFRGSFFFDVVGAWICFEDFVDVFIRSFDGGGIGHLPNRDLETNVLRAKRAYELARLHFGICDKFN